MKKAKAGVARVIAPCIACNQACLDHTFEMKIASCLVNPQAAHETELVYAKTEAPKRIAVVGAGPAGLSTAFFGLVDWFATMLEETGVTVRLKTEADVAALAGFDEVVVATGVLPRDPGIEVAGGQVVSYIDILTGRVTAGDRVAIIGAGGIGFDVAEYLTHEGESPTENLSAWLEEWGVADPGEHRAGLAPEGPKPSRSPREVSLFQRKAERPGKRLGKTTGWIHRASLQMKGVKIKEVSVLDPGDGRGGRAGRQAGDRPGCAAGRVFLTGFRAIRIEFSHWRVPPSHPYHGVR